MDCEQFDSQFKLFTSYPMEPRVAESSDFQAWHDHRSGCQRCGDAFLAHEATRCGVTPSDHPCVHVAYLIAQDPLSSIEPISDPDVTLTFDSKNNRYGIPVRDGGSSYIEVFYCPWCGVPLPGSAA